MRDRRLLAWAGVAGLVAWGLCFLATFSRMELVGAEYTWLRAPMLGADFWSQSDYASRLWVTGGDPYANETHFFHYPPIVIRLFRWSPFFDRRTALLIWMVVLVGLIALGTIVSLRTRRKLGLAAPPAPLAVFAVLATFPAIFAVERSNFDLITLVAMLICLALMERGGPLRDFLGGAVLAVGPWVKLYPGLMGVGLVALRRWWTVAGFAFGGVGIGLLTPTETMRSFHILGLAIKQNEKLAAYAPYNWWSHSLSIAWTRATSVLRGQLLGEYFASVSPSVAALVFIAPVLGWVTLRVFRSRNGDAVAYPLLLWICALASCLPIIANDYSLVFLPIAAAAVYGPGVGRSTHVAAALALPWLQPFFLPFIPPLALLVCKLSGLVAVGASLVRRVDALDAADAREPLRPFGGVAARWAEWVAAPAAGQPLYFEIFTTSLGALLLEIAYTRIFSFKIFYYFTYVLLGVGLLGIGAGGIALATSARLRQIPASRLIPVAATAGGASVLAGYLIMSPMHLDIAQDIGSPFELFKFTFVAVLLTASFFCVGLVISSILAARPEAASRLYGADLLGAALGCAIAVPLIAFVGPPRAVMLAGVFLVAAGMRLARPSRRLVRASAAVAALLAVPASIWGLLPDPVVSLPKQLEDYRKRPDSVWFSQWSPVFRVDVLTDPFALGSKFITFHDGQVGASLRYWDGVPGSVKELERDPRALPFDVAPRQPKVLIIGAAAGHEVVASLYFGASHVTGVELNPVTYSLVDHYFAGVTGNLTRHPQVTYVNGDGRWFLKQSGEKYDLIWFVAPDSYAAMNASTSGAFVLSESYLYTAEMVKETFQHLTPGGVIGTHFGELAYERKPNRTTRYVSTLRAALEEEGVPDFSRQVMVASAITLPPFLETVVVTGREPFSADQMQAFARRTTRLDGGRVRYSPDRAPDDSPVNKAITLPHEELPGFYAARAYQLTPVRDDRPFFWHFVPFRDALRTDFIAADGSVMDHEDGLGERLMIVFLAVATLLAVVFLLLPLLTIRAAFREMPHKVPALLYFAALGLGFMFLEVALLQKLTLLLGYPTYSLSVTLFSLLLSSGAGSILTGRLEGGKNRNLLTAFFALTGVVLTGQAMLPSLIEHFVGSSLPVRVLIAAGLTAPVGLCLGTFMPIGLRTVSALSARSQEYVAWAWAINGVFSVIASILSTIIGMVLGFRGLLLVSLAVYLVGVLAMLRVPEARRAG